MIARCRDTQTTVTLLSVDLLSQAQPLVVTIGLSNDSAPDGPGSEPYRTDLLTNDPTINGTVADAQGLVRLEAQIDDGPLLDDSDQSAATGGTSTPQDATAARLHPIVRQHSASPTVWIDLQLVTFLWLNVRNSGKYGIEFVPAASAGAFFQIFHGRQRRELLGYGRGNELVHGNAVLLGTLFQLLVYGIWQSKAQRRTHGTRTNFFRKAVYQL